MVAVACIGSLSFVWLLRKLRKREQSKSFLNLFFLFCFVLFLLLFQLTTSCVRPSGVEFQILTTFLLNLLCWLIVLCLRAEKSEETEKKKIEVWTFNFFFLIIFVKVVILSSVELGLKWCEEIYSNLVVLVHSVLFGWQANWGDGKKFKFEL